MQSYNGSMCDLNLHLKESYKYYVIAGIIIYNKAINETEKVTYGDDELQ